MTRIDDNSGARLRIATHAVERWIARVDPGASIGEARFALQRFVTLGRRRPYPRRFMRGQVRQEPGTSFIYNSRNPGVCAVVTNGVVVTVLTRDLFDAPRHHLRMVRDGAPMSAAERARRRWQLEDVELNEAA